MFAIKYVDDTTSSTNQIVLKLLRLINRFNNSKNL